MGFRFWYGWKVALAGLGVLSACGGGYSVSQSNNNNTSGACGDGVVDVGEQCDGAALDGETCVGLGFAGGALACSGQCTFDTSGCGNVAQCGDGVAEGTEECDGADLASQTCVSLGWDAGTLACDAACHFDTGACEGTGPVCGNGVVELGEACDATALDGETCQSQGFVAGTLGCLGDCTFDTSGCANQLCGNAQQEGTEECDDADLAGETCVSQGFDSGTLGCAGDCTFDTSGCVNETCGNGVIDAGEQCEGANLGGQDCQGLGFLGGTLGCAGNCVYDTSGCLSEICGNGTREGSEDCDQTDLAGADCATFGYDGGTLGCTAGCAFDTTGCWTQVCGNGTIEPPEQCDGGALGGQDCAGLGFDGGTLGCSGSCAFDTSGCWTQVCGNGTIEPPEQCDGGDLGGQDCAGLGFTGGTLGCTGGCAFDTSQCTGTGCSANGGVASCPTTDTGNTANPPAVDLVDTWWGAGCSFQHTGPEVVYHYNPGGQSEHVQVDLTGLSADLDLFVLESANGACDPALPCISTSYTGGAGAEQVQFLAQANTSYFVVVDGYGGAVSPYTINFGCVQPTQMIYEFFEWNTPDVWDLNGTTITFTPDGAAPNGYTFVVVTGVGAFPSPLGTGTGQAQVAFTQPDDSVEIPLTSGNFPFFGVSYSSFWINTHGNITFGQGDTNSNETPVDFAAGPPRIAGEWDIMDPTAVGGGRVHIERFTGRLAVTWDWVDDPYTTTDHAVQIELYQTGQIRITNLSSGGTDGLCGITEGGGAPIPEVNFVP